ncbi:hypothetical protein BAJUN_01900 [Bajunvirus bajun]|uniref:Uncharacterized protein n=1 Tax=Brevundimonas phage vB_BgoS-Bajun TaxID=2948594 RepID=A0A9E7N678_9CAUD|nr:hypothetical protein BAJUN_01900 [Brevundimonas phage vB_BgoS-Bajun]
MRAVLAALGAALALGACAPSAGPSYTLLGVDAAGEGYALDTRQTLADCQRQTFDYDLRFVEKLCVAEAS